MKTVLLFLASCFIFLLGNAQPNIGTADLTIGTTSNNNLRIKINGKRMALKERSVTFDNLPTGNYNIVIQQLQRRANGMNDFIDVYSNNIRLTARKHVEILVMRFGKVVVDEGFSNNDDWNDFGFNNGNNGFWNNQNVISNAQFADVKRTLQSYSFDNDKLAAAKTIMRNKWFNVAQIKELANMFSFDNNKLDFLKEAYAVCIENEQYYLLAETLSFNNSKRDFMNWLRTAA